MIGHEHVISTSFMPTANAGRVRTAKADQPTPLTGT
jgi:hypothetical protein